MSDPPGEYFIPPNEYFVAPPPAAKSIIAFHEYQPSSSDDDDDDDDEHNEDGSQDSHKNTDSCSMDDAKPASSLSLGRHDDDMIALSLAVGEVSQRKNGTDAVRLDGGISGIGADEEEEEEEELELSAETTAQQEQQQSQQLRTGMHEYKKQLSESPLFFTDYADIERTNSATATATATAASRDDETKAPAIIITTTTTSRNGDPPSSRDASVVADESSSAAAPPPHLRLPMEGRSGTSSGRSLLQPLEDTTSDGNASSNHAAFSNPSDVAAAHADRRARLGAQLDPEQAAAADVAVDERKKVPDAAAETYHYRESDAPSAVGQQNANAPGFVPQVLVRHTDENWRVEI